MFRSTVSLLLITVLSCVADTATAEPPLADSRPALRLRLHTRPYHFGPQTRLGLLSTPERERLRCEFDGLRATPSFDLQAVSWAERFGGLRRTELSRTECAYKGVGAGATMGLWLGTLGTAADLWDEQTSWYMAGAFAAAGAILGGTVGAENPTWNVRYEWDEIDEDFFDE